MSFLVPPRPDVHLVPQQPRPAAVSRRWPVDLPTQGSYRLIGTAGSGVTSFLIDTVVNAVIAGADPSGVLVITASKETGAHIRSELGARLAALPGFATETSIVRSIHSVAFALLRDLLDDPIRLITGADQDAQIQELLAGQAEMGGASWPEDYRPALTLVGFARQLRDFMLRAAERGLTPSQVEELGRTYRRPMWISAGAFMREYEHTAALMSATSYRSFSASELVSMVLREIDKVDTPTTTGKLEGFSSPWHTVIVDDAQHLDPKSAELAGLLLDHARLAIVAGDPRQSVFHFRGARPDFLLHYPADHEITLPESHRRPRKSVEIVPSVPMHHDLLADTVRRAHLDEGIPWSQIAVIARSTGDLGSLRRVLLANGVPVHLNPTDVVLSEQRIVAAMLEAIKALRSPLSATELDDLLLGPVGGADPVTLRRLFRGLRRLDTSTRAIETLRGYIDPGAVAPFNDEELRTVLTDREMDILDRIRGVLAAGRDALDRGEGVETVLWEIWAATGLSDRLMAISLRGGAAGSQADRDLDAMMALFDAAGDYTERKPTGSLAGFAASIAAQELPTGVRDRRLARPEAVSLLTAHGVVGQEWDTVVVTGAQEGQWPSVGLTGTTFDMEEFMDLIDRDIDPDLPVSRLEDRVREEERLFYLATTRARRRLVVIAVDSSEAAEVLEPSRMLEKFCAEWGINQTVHEDAATAAGAEEAEQALRVLSQPVLIAELRRVVCSPEAREDERTQAARQLARLARAGVPGASPSEWATTTTPSTTEPQRDDRPALSPSKIEALLACPMNAALRSLMEEDEVPEPLVKGTMIHAFAEALGRGADAAEAHRITEEAWDKWLSSPEWKKASDAEAFTELLEATRALIVKRNASHELVGVEESFDLTLDNGVRIRGRIDRVDRNADAELCAVDYKTGTTVPTHAKAQDNPQLKTYQLALRAQGDVGGGTLLYPAKGTGKAAVRDQDPKPDEDLAAFAELLPPLVDEMVAPQLTARISDACDRCPLHTICPLQPEGKALTHA